MLGKKRLRLRRSGENEEEEDDKGLSLDRLLNADATWQKRERTEWEMVTMCQTWVMRKMAAMHTNIG